MRKVLLSLLILLCVATASAQDRLTDACARFEAFNNEYFLKGRVPKAKAQEEFKALTGQIMHYMMISSHIVPANRPWVFPLQGYKYGAIGGSNGNGYNDKGFNYLDGNKHTAHPAHDIFINDKNQDNLDDRTLQPVNVVAVDDGVVIACADSWEVDSPLKGGKFIWMYSGFTGVLTYYAHNQNIFVKTGDYIRQGQKIAEVGRTGLNAYKKRSPTHLHFSSFKLVDNIPVPFNSYLQLKKALSK